MTEINDIKPAVGQIQIADEVIAIIAATAVQEVEGITTIQGGGITDLFGKKNNQSKGVKVTVEGNEVKAELELAAKYGVKLQQAATEVQEKVKNALETMTGLEVTAIDVRITAIATDKKAKDEPEAE